MIPDAYLGKILGMSASGLAVSKFAEVKAIQTQPTTFWKYEKEATGTERFQVPIPHCEKYISTFGAPGFL